MEKSIIGDTEKRFAAVLFATHWKRGFATGRSLTGEMILVRENEDAQAKARLASPMLEPLGITKKGRHIEMNTQSAPAPGINEVLSYWNRRPCNIRHSPRNVGSKEYFDEVEARKYFVEPHIPEFAQFARWSHKRVLEIGCGIGTDAVNFARHGANYTGVDLSDVSLELAQRRFATYGLTGSLFSHNAEALDRVLPAKSFDLVYSFGVIHHTPRPRSVIESARRLIRADGELRIMLYAKNSWKAIMIEAGLDQPEAQNGCPIALTYTAQEVETLLDGLFYIVDLRQAHIFGYEIEKYVRYEYERQPWFKSMPPEVFAALERRLGWHLLVVARPL